MILERQTSACRPLNERSGRLLSGTAMGAVEQFLIHSKWRIHHERS